MTDASHDPSRRTAAAGTIAGLTAAAVSSLASTSGTAGSGGAARAVPLAVSDAGVTGQLSSVRTFRSAHAAARRVDVWLPPGLERGARAPLLVIQDGQNLFEARHGMGGQTWQMDQAALRQPVAPVIIGVWNTPARRREYLPADMEQLLPLDIRERIASANGGPPLSDGYLAFLADELVPWARATLPVSHRRRDTLVALCRYPDLFGAAGCLSMHWPLLTDAAAYQRGELETPRVLAALDRFAQRSLVRPGRHRLFLDRGTRNLDSLYPPYSAHMDRAMAALGWREANGLRSLVIEGGDHNEASWRTRVDAALSWLLPHRR
jgi:enterochelin esterase-like enzyme